MSSPARAGNPHNHLTGETSPYLLQHAANPVNWWPWGPAALSEAQRTGKPVLLSVGYAACHWCHVMAHESFEDPATATVMNTLFVNIKVDREERPDIDQIYMNALHQLGEQGGWPLTMFLTPEGAPFWGGTYFPKEARFGRPSFIDVLESIAQTYRDAPDRIAHNRDALLERLRARAQATPVTVGLADLDDLAASILNAADPVNGGLRVAPKFPQCAMLEYLWRAGARSGDARLFEAADFALTRMSLGGIYDHLGGGYARYAVDAQWLVPHFEKMLYDNAQILELLALAFTRGHNALFRQRAEETVGWLMREMTTREGAFASSMDADSEGEEGRYYVWSREEIVHALGPDDGALFARHYGATDAGNFESRNILNQLGGLEASAEPRLAPLRAKLLAVRQQRVAPGLDDKVLADWNGLMIAALARAGLVFARPDWLSLARRAFDFIATTMTRHDRLGHSCRAGKVLFPGLASDHAAMVRAALALHEASGEGGFLERALAWQGALEDHFADTSHGGYFLTADDAEGLIVRPHGTVDDAIPNHNSLIAHNLVRLAALTGDARWRQRAHELFDALLPLAADNLFGHLALLNALDLHLTGRDIVVTGDDEQADALVAAALALPFVSRTVLRAPDAARLAPDHPARAMIAAAKEGAAAFVCHGQSCAPPVTDAAGLRAIL
ncbi:MAG: thioredoxin domain-containing protein [Xanthobacteraceae bacterium]|nr:MAG: thioredoxin domain-containing protein [Xanthobacteraceae bacterium]